jgi:hypothetical protein
MRMLKFLLYIVITLLALIVLAPKKNLYYLFEDKLNKHNILITSTKVEERLFGVTIRDVTLSYRSNNIAKIGQIDISLFIVWNSIRASQIELDETIALLVPKTLEYMDATYNLITLFIIDFDSENEIGVFNGKVDLKGSKIFVELAATDQAKKKYQMLLNNMRYSNGIYRYAYSY